MADHQLDEYGMAVINGVRYRPDEIPPGLAEEPPAEEPPAEEPKKAPAKKAAPAAANKAKVPETGGDAGESAVVATK